MYRTWNDLINGYRLWAIIYIIIILMIPALTLTPADDFASLKIEGLFCMIQSVIDISILSPGITVQRTIRITYMMSWRRSDKSLYELMTNPCIGACVYFPTLVVFSEYVCSYSTRIHWKISSKHNKATQNRIHIILFMMFSICLGSIQTQYHVSCTHISLEEDVACILYF